MNKALLIVDPQNDFISGSLPVPGGETAMTNLSRYLKGASQNYALKIVTCDNHPWEHCSFQENGGPWPRHCVSHSQGAAIWPGLLESLYESPGPVKILLKGAKTAKDEYSIFQDESGKLALLGLLDEYAIKGIDICGLAGDVCVLNTLKDGASLFGPGFFTVLPEFSPSLDGGKSLSEFCAKEAICAR